MFISVLLIVCALVLTSTALAQDKTEKTTTILNVSDVDKLDSDEMATKMVRLKYIKVDDLQKLLSQFVSNEQDVFKLKEMILKRAQLVTIEAGNIQIDRNGEIEGFLMEDSSASTPTEGIADTADQTEFSVTESELSDALANLPRLLSQARAVPYFRNGKSIGMRFFAIRRGSLYEKLGLKNGDILLAINDNSIKDPLQALMLFEQLKSERSINVKLERGGETSDLRYSIQ